MRNHSGGKFGVGLGAAAAAAITYYLYGTKKGAERREQIKGMAKKAKERVTEKKNDITAITEEVYTGIKNAVKDRYEEFKDVDKKDLGDLGSRMKIHWEEMLHDIESTVSKARALAKKKAPKLLE